MELINLLIPLAHAEGAAPATGMGGGMEQIILILLFIAVFYFLLIRPQQKRAKQHKKLIAELAKGDEVTTSSGFYGRIIKLGESHLELEIADKVQVVVQKASVVSTLPKGTIESLKG